MHNHLETILNFVFQSAGNRELPTKSLVQVEGEIVDVAEEGASESHTTCWCLQELLKLISHMQLPLDDGVLLCIPNFMAWCVR